MGHMYCVPGASNEWGILRDPHYPGTLNPRSIVAYSIAVRCAMVRSVLHAIVVFAILLLTASNWPREARAQSADALDSLRTQVNQLYSQGKYAQAAPIAERYVAWARQRHGEDHIEYATSVARLADVYKAQGRYSEAEPLYKRALAIDEKSLNPEHLDVARDLNNLAGLYNSQGRYAETESLYKRSLAIREKALGTEHPDVGQSLNNLAEPYLRQGRYAEAEPLLKRSLAIRERALGAEHPDVATALNGLGELYRVESRYAEAEPLLTHALAIRENALGPEHPDVATALNGLALLYSVEGRYAEAEPLLTRALAIRENALGPEHPDVGTAIASLAYVYSAQGRNSEAEPLNMRSLTIYEKAFGGEHPWVATAINNLAALYQSQGRYPEAEPLHKRALAIREKALGPEHPDVAQSRNNLAALYQAQGRSAEAEPLYKRALAIWEKALGPEHPNVAAVLYSLAELYRAQGRYAVAEPLYERALPVREKALGPYHAEVGQLLNNYAALYYAQGRYADAEPLHKRALAIYEKAFGREHPVVAGCLINLAVVYQAQGRYAEAESLLKRALAIDEQALGPEHPDVGAAIAWLANIYNAQGRNTEAEPLYKRSLAIRDLANLEQEVLAAAQQGDLQTAEQKAKRFRDLARETKGENSVKFGDALRTSAMVDMMAGRMAEAEVNIKRALAIYEKLDPPNKQLISGMLAMLAAIDSVQGRKEEGNVLMRRGMSGLADAIGADQGALLSRLSELDINNPALFDEMERIYKTMVDLSERSGQRRSAVIGRITLASLYATHNHCKDAEQILREADQQMAAESGFGPFERVMAKENLAKCAQSRSEFAEAEQLYKAAIAELEPTLGPFSMLYANSLHQLSYVYLATNRPAEALDAVRRVVEAYRRRLRSGRQEVSRGAEASATRFAFDQQIVAAWAMSRAPGARKESLLREAFEAAQWSARNKAGEALNLLGGRLTEAGAQRSSQIRRLQDAREDWQRLDRELGSALAGDDSAKLADIRRRIEVATEILSEAESVLAREAPDFAALTNLETISVDEARALLKPAEALVVLATSEKGSFAFVLTPTATRWIAIPRTEDQLADAVRGLRCGLDAVLWNDEPAAARCRDLVRGVPERDGFGNIRAETLPFDANRAHALYQALLGPIEDVIKDKHLLIVPSGALTQLPFQVLISDKPAPALSGRDALRRAAWLIRSHALTVLPSVSSLKALRRLAKKSHASRTLIGFGNPLLNGPDAEYAKLAADARSKTSCSELRKQRLAALTGKRRGLLPLSLRSGLADGGEIRSQVPLPETADELCTVARDLGASEKDVWLGNRATEAEIKRLSEAGELSKYRIIHFATHGALAGQLGGNSEPGLILTPPETATERDDGYLSALEIAGLKLDADWVILSACNTAAGSAEGAEALSGLARAFFYAGARTLLVSHWAVASNATVKLITGAVGRMASDKGVGRAEAMRQSMLALIDKGEAHEGHPAFWAPFVVVGEGAAR
jgi:tetratricopeptide (TPR) repeat protein/CHAT domain-containing protein